MASPCNDWNQSCGQIIGIIKRGDIIGKIVRIVMHASGSSGIVASCGKGVYTLESDISVGPLGGTASMFTK